MCYGNRHDNKIIVASSTDANGRRVHFQNIKISMYYNLSKSLPSLQLLFARNLMLLMWKMFMEQLYLEKYKVKY